MPNQRVIHFCSRCAAPANVRRALLTALIVGPLLALINQYPALRALIAGGMISAIVVVRILLTFLVPFGVSLSASALADLSRDPDVTPEERSSRPGVLP